MRIRTIKPEFFHHEGLYDAEVEAGLPLRLAFAGLWCAADRAGRFKWEPRRLGVQILPYDQIEFSRVLDALVTRGFLVKYRVGDEDFGLIPSFAKHHIINNREKESILPEPPESLTCDASTTREAREGHAGTVEGKGREGNMEGKGEREALSREARVKVASETESLIDRILAVYPKKSGLHEAKHILADLHQAGVDLEDVFRRTGEIAAIISTRTPAEQLLVPSANRFFLERRFLDDPKSFRSAKSVERDVPVAGGWSDRPTFVPETSTPSPA